MFLITETTEDGIGIKFWPSRKELVIVLSTESVPVVLALVDHLVISADVILYFKYILSIPS